MGSIILNDEINYELKKLDKHLKISKKELSNQLLILNINKFNWYGECHCCLKDNEIIEFNNKIFCKTSKEHIDKI